MQPLYYPDNSPNGQKLNVEEKKTRLRNESNNNGDRNDRDRSDRGMSRSVTGNGGSGGGGGNGGSNPRSNGDRVGMNRTPNTGILRGNPSGGNTQPRTGGPGNARPFNRNDRQQSGPRGNNNGTTNTTGSGGYQRR